MAALVLTFFVTGGPISHAVAIALRHAVEIVPVVCNFSGETPRDLGCAAEAEQVDFGNVVGNTFDDIVLVRQCSSNDSWLI